MSDWRGDPAERSNGDATRAGSAGDAAGHVATLVDAGLPWEAGLRALSEEAPSPRMRRLLRRMSDELAGGAPPEEVLSRPARGLPNYLRGLIKAGVQTAQLGAFLEQFLASIRRRREAALSFWGMMAYPLLLLPFAFLIGMALLGWIVPQFREIFEDFGTPLPAVTLFVVNLSSRPVVIGLFVGVPAVIALTALLIAIGRYVPGHAWRLRMFQRIPLIGTPSRMRGLAEFCSLLGLLVSGRIPLPEALRMTASAVHDANLKQGARRLATRVEQGESLEVAAAGLPQFSRELRNLFRWSPRGDAFGDILLRSGEVYASRSRVQAGLIVMVFQPMIFVAAAMFIGFVITALFMPLVKLLNELA